MSSEQKGNVYACCPRPFARISQDPIFSNPSLNTTGCLPSPHLLMLFGTMYLEIRHRVLDFASGSQAQCHGQCVWMSGTKPSTICLEVRHRVLDNMSGSQAQSLGQCVWKSGIESSTVCLEVRNRGLYSVSGSQAQSLRQHVWRSYIESLTMCLEVRHRVLDNVSGSQAYRWAMSLQVRHRVLQQGQVFPLFKLNRDLCSLLHYSLVMIPWQLSFIRWSD